MELMEGGAFSTHQSSDAEMPTHINFRAGEVCEASTASIVEMLSTSSLCTDSAKVKSREPREAEPGDRQ